MANTLSAHPEQPLSAEARSPFRLRLKKAFLAAVIQFPKTLRRYPFVAVFLALYGVSRVILNMMVGASAINAVRPMLLSLFFAGVSIILIDTIHFLMREPIAAKEAEARRWKSTSPWLTVFLLFMLFFWSLSIIDHLQVSRVMAGTPVLGWLPGWRALGGAMESIASALNSILPAVPAAAFKVTITSLLLWAIIPTVLLMRSGLRRRDLGLSFNRWQIVSPFILIGVFAFVFGGITERGLAILGIGLLYPALTEELFFRGMLQPSLKRWLRPGYAVLAVAILFGLNHLPSLAFESFHGVWPLAVTNMGDVTITGIVWGYGVERTRSILPWAVYHSISNVVGF